MGTSWLVPSAFIDPKLAHPRDGTLQGLWVKKHVFLLSWPGWCIGFIKRSGVAEQTNFFRAHLGPSKTHCQSDGQVSPAHALTANRACLPSHHCHPLQYPTCYHFVRIQTNFHFLRPLCLISFDTVGILLHFFCVSPTYGGISQTNVEKSNHNNWPDTNVFSIDFLTIPAITQHTQL